MDKQYCKRILEKGGRSRVRPTILKNIWTFSFNAKNGRDSSVFIVCWYTLLIFIFLQSRFNNIHVYFTFKIDTYKSVDCTLWVYYFGVYPNQGKFKEIFHKSIFLVVFRLIFFEETIHALV